MKELIFSFKGSATVPQGPQLTVPAPVPETQTVISVSRGRSCYVFIDRAARHFRRWITVTAGGIRRAVVRFYVCARVSRSVLRVRDFAFAGGLRL